MQKEII